MLVTAYRPAPERWSSDFRRRVKAMTRSIEKNLVHEGKYAAEVPVELDRG